MTTIETTAGPAISSDLAATLGTLREVHHTARTRPLAWREAQLKGIAAMLEEREVEFTDALTADLGRGADESYLGDIAGTNGEIAYALKHLRRWVRPSKVGLPLAQLPGRASVAYEPLGTVLIIGPWNYPVYLTLSPLVAALSAGNCAVVKPSEHAPATSAVLARRLPEYVDSDAVKVIEGGPEVTQELLGLGFDHALFTGGTDVGRLVLAGAASSLTPVTLELGGKCPALVAPDADLDVVARRIAWVKLMNSGQMCIAPDHVIVHSSVKDALVSRIVETLKEFRSDLPDAGQRIVNERQFDRLKGYLDATRGTVVAGGGHDRAALTIEPTVILDPAADEPSMSEEIFGPILPIVTYDSLDDVIAGAKRKPKPLAFYLFSGSKQTQQRVIDEVSAGAVVVNHVAQHCLIPGLPLGGVGASGMGAYHGRFGFETFSHRKAVLVKRFKPDLKFVYPPYTEKTLKLLRRLA
ncbi:aldehyde dehydrogenase family protein [Nocardioides humilatus]|uniref:Aldehyde dehydrogenase n=1 Tax=Nocardioides humilatus TaxID=2607660 RepID=A0A5B1L9J2_9ACTN|nr:aldehyde dehydrogenase family protein [Nocardioides humilatus]KAA1416954.1 aldehyde dehydrogenase family protein [Nocardioides humilatus]